MTGHLKSVTAALKAIAFELLGREEKKRDMIAIFDKAASPIGGVEWEFLELRGFLNWGVQRSKISEQTSSILCQMIDHFEEKLLPKDRSTGGLREFKKIKALAIWLARALWMLWVAVNCKDSVNANLIA